MTAINEVVDLCQTIGKKIPLWTQGAGSNISVKAEGQLFVKATGLRLDEVKSDKHVAFLDVDGFCKNFRALGIPSTESSDRQESAYAQIIRGACLEAGSSARGSMESGFHACLPGRVVLHFHSLVALAAATEKNRDALEKIAISFWGKEFSYALISPILPGFELSFALAKQPHCKIFFLQNHGVVMQTDRDPHNDLEKWQEFEDQICHHFGWERKAKPLSDSCPFRLYTPDMAIFADRIKSHLKPVDVSRNVAEVMYSMSDEAQSLDRDAFELWRCARYLYDWDQSIPEFPQHLAAKVSTLPTEKNRLGK